VTSNLYSFSARTISRIYFLKDYYSEKEAREAIAHPAIVHFTTGLVGRPWEENCSHPKAKAFWDTVKDTPWSDLKPAKDSRKAGLRAFTFVYEHMPLGLFETLYRAFSWTLHLRK
jgi:lipopolysaccharide biosynthesis glycosyltransferase